MPRLSLWRENKSSDFKFIDRRISEMFTIGGTGVLLHKYLGAAGGTGADATVPAYGSDNVTNIQDLLFVENRDRKYDTTVYKLRGIYQKADQDFDLSQFGIFLAQGTQFMTFHLEDTVENIGRKPLPGDVVELMHMRDYWSIDDAVPFAINRFYVISEVSWAAEGFSPTWYPHLWRCKLQPLVDSQEYKDILNKISANPDPFTANAAVDPLSSVISNYNIYRGLNESIIAQAEIDVPESGYNTANLFTISKSTTKQYANPVDTKVATGNVNIAGQLVVELTTASARSNTNRILVANNAPALKGATIHSNSIPLSAGVTVVNVIGRAGLLLSSNVTIANNEVITLSYAAPSVPTTDTSVVSPNTKVKGYMSGDGTAPNGLAVAMGIAFPEAAKTGDYFLRLDYVPNQLFRYDGLRWIKIEDNVRTSLTPGSPSNQTMRSSFVNDTNTFTDSAGTHNERVSLSKVLTPKADN